MENQALRQQLAAYGLVPELPPTQPQSVRNRDQGDIAAANATSAALAAEVATLSAQVNSHAEEMQTLRRELAAAQVAQEASAHRLKNSMPVTAADAPAFAAPLNGEADQEVVRLSEQVENLQSRLATLTQVCSFTGGCWLGKIDGR